MYHLRSREICCMLFDFVFCPRILRNVQVKIGGHVTVKVIITHSREDVTITFDDKAIGTVLNDLFGNQISSRRVSLKNGTLTREYSSFVLSRDIGFSELTSNWIPLRVMRVMRQAYVAGARLQLHS